MFGRHHGLTIRVFGFFDVEMRGLLGEHGCEHHVQRWNVEEEGEEVGEAEWYFEEEYYNEGGDDDDLELRND